MSQYQRYEFKVQENENLVKRLKEQIDQLRDQLSNSGLKIKEKENRAR